MCSVVSTDENKNETTCRVYTDTGCGMAREKGECCYVAFSSLNDRPFLPSSPSTTHSLNQSMPLPSSANQGTSFLSSSISNDFVPSTSTLLTDAAHLSSRHSQLQLETRGNNDDGGESGWEIHDGDDEQEDDDAFERIGNGRDDGVLQESVPLVPFKTRLSAQVEEDDDDNDNDFNEENNEEGTFPPFTRSQSKNHRTKPNTRSNTKGQGENNDALAQVRAVVKETDNPSLPNITFRVLLLGSILCAVGAAVSQLFFVSSISSFSHESRKEVRFCVLSIGGDEQSGRARWQGGVGSSRRKM